MWAGESSRVAISRTKSQFATGWSRVTTSPGEQSVAWQAALSSSGVDPRPWTTRQRWSTRRSNRIRRSGSQEREERYDTASLGHQPPVSPQCIWKEASIRLADDQAALCSGAPSGRGQEYSWSPPWA